MESFAFPDQIKSFDVIISLNWSFERKLIFLQPKILTRSN